MGCVTVFMQAATKAPDEVSTADVDTSIDAPAPLTFLQVLCVPSLPTLATRPPSTHIHTRAYAHAHPHSYTHIHILTHAAAAADLKRIRSVELLEDARKGSLRISVF